MGWSAWIPVGGPAGGFDGRTAAVSRNPEVTNIYVRGADGALWQQAYWAGSWNGWGRHNDGMQLRSAPALGSMGPDHEHVFAVGTDGQLWQKWWNGSWSGWISLGAPSAGIVGDPVTVSRNNTVCNVYVRGGDNSLWQLPYYDGFWHDWERHDDGAVLTSAPGLGTMGPDHEHVFAVGTDGQLWQKWWNGSWSGWISLGAPSAGIVNDPVTISRNGAVCNVYVRGGDNSLWQRAYYDGYWHGWGRHEDGAILTSTPGVISRGSDHETVVRRGTDARVYLKWWIPGLPTVDVNLITVGRDFFTAANNTKMIDSATIARQIFEQVGFNIGTIRHYGIDRVHAGALEIIDSLAEAEELTRLWTVPNNALDVFVVRSMNGADGWSAVGGSCDKNSMGMTGSVVSLNGSLANAGNTFAHEMGHYLGLSHIADADNFIGGNGASNSNTHIHAWQGDSMKKHCFVFHV